MTIATISELGAVLTGTRIVHAEALQCDIPVQSVRHDAVQDFVKQETILVRVTTEAGLVGVGYSYTIGTGGSAVLSLLRDYLLPQMVGLDSARPEHIWQSLFKSTRSTTTGAITCLALAAIDTAVWDAKCQAIGLPLWMAGGGAQSKVPVYDTEGGWLNLETDELVRHALDSKDRGMRGVKIKIGKAKAYEDAERLTAVRDAVGPDIDIMVDANQCFTAAEAIQRAALFEPLDLFWFEEPLPADDITGHQRLAASTTIPIAVGESLYSLGQFREYLHAGAAAIVQADVSRVGGITPWFKIAHLAEASNVKMAPHFLMELHLSLLGAIENVLYLEHIPQLASVTLSEIEIIDGFAHVPQTPGLGIEWDFNALDKIRVA